VQAGVDARLDVDVNNYLPDCLLVKVDIATMAHGLEGRSPLLDHEFMELAASLPSHLKRRGSEGKYLVKRAVRDLVPAEILHRKKMGFGVPLDHWFRRDLYEMTSDLLLTGPGARRGLFDVKVLRSLLQEHRAGTASWHDQLWNLLMLEHWFQTFIDKRPKSDSQRDAVRRDDSGVGLRASAVC
jgi:asparagine synthase (glutamine-hydrolysing)